MRSKILYLLVLTTVLLLLCGCSHGQSLGERAIVKAVYVNPLSTGNVEAALIVFTCEPSSDTSSATGKAQIYHAQGINLEEALYKAERQQNKSAFYAQNQLLLLGPGAVKQDISPYLQYFGQEDVGRLNLAVYLIQQSGEELSEYTDVIEQVVQEGERLAERTLPQSNPSRSIYESVSGKEGENGWLPILEFSKESDDFIGVRKAALFKEGVCYEFWNETELQMALFLDGKSKSLALQTQQNGNLLSIKTGALALKKEVTQEGEKMILNLSIEGKIEHLSFDGHTSTNGASEQELKQVNTCVEDIANAIVADSFYKQNDVFQWEWWLRLFNAEQVCQWKQKDQLNTHAQIRIESMLQSV